MKEYHVTLVAGDCTSVDAESEAEAKQIAIDIFEENGYDMDRGYELEIEEGDGEYLDIIYEVLGKDKVEEIVMSWCLKEAQDE